MSRLRKHPKTLAGLWASRPGSSTSYLMSYRLSYVCVEWIPAIELCCDPVKLLSFLVDSLIQA